MRYSTVVCRWTVRALPLPCCITLVSVTSSVASTCAWGAVRATRRNDWPAATDAGTDARARGKGGVAGRRRTAVGVPVGAGVADSTGVVVDVAVLLGVDDGVGGVVPVAVGVAVARGVLVDVEVALGGRVFVGKGVLVGIDELLATVTA